MRLIFCNFVRGQSRVCSAFLTLAAMAWLGTAVHVAKAADAEPLPAPADLHKMFEAAEYQPLLVKLTRVMQLKGDAALPYDHVDLATLKGNTLLEMKQQASAVASLNEAIKAITDQTDPKIANQARATLILVKRSQLFAYSPKTPPAKPIGILDMAQRKAAFTALLADLRAEVGAKAKTAKSGNSLPPIIEAVRSISDMRAVEMIATESDTESQQLAKDLAGQAKTLMADAVQSMSKRATEINTDANAAVASPARAASGKYKPANTNTPEQKAHKFGLTTKMTNELKQIVDSCTKLDGVAKDFEDVSKEDALAFKEIASTADRTAKAATVTLNADYSGYRKP